MKNLKKVLAMCIVGLILLRNSSFATDVQMTESTSNNGRKMIYLGIALVLIVLVLYMSYKSDSPSEPRVSKNKEVKKDKLKDELVEKDNTYEVEEDEVYEEDSIEPVSVGKDEDEISLFESVNNPDTEKEETVIKEPTSFVTKTKGSESKSLNREKFGKGIEIKNPEETVNDFFENEEDEIIEETSEEYEEFEDVEEEKEIKGTSDGTMIFDSSELNSKVNIFDNSDDEEEYVYDEEENVSEFDELEETSNEDDDDSYSYNYDFDFDDEKEKEEEETKPEEEEKEEDLFEDVVEPTEFVGFTTIKPKTKTRGGNSRFDRPNYSRNIEENEVIEEVEETKVQKEEVSENENSADDFLAQMAKNLGREDIKEKKVEKKATRKTTTAKKTEKKASTTTKKAASAKTNSAAKTTTRAKKTVTKKK